MTTTTTTTTTTTEHSTQTISANLKAQWDFIIEAGKPSDFSFVTADENENGDLEVTYTTKLMTTTAPTIIGTFTTSKYVR